MYGVNFFEMQVVRHSGKTLGHDKTYSSGFLLAPICNRAFHFTNML